MLKCRRSKLHPNRQIPYIARQTLHGSLCPCRTATQSCARLRATRRFPVLFFGDGCHKARRNVGIPARGTSCWRRVTSCWFQCSVFLSSVVLRMLEKFGSNLPYYAAMVVSHMMEFGASLRSKLPRLKTAWRQNPESHKPVGPSFCNTLEGLAGSLEDVLLG